MRATVLTRDELTGEDVEEFWQQNVDMVTGTISYLPQLRRLKKKSRNGTNMIGIKDAKWNENAPLGRKRNTP